jgi:hypothetical protein
MKSLRMATSLVFLIAAATAFAQSDAQKTFEQLKTLNGSWEGKSANGQSLKVVFRPTAGGSALVSEILGAEDMISMIHIDNNRVLLTHYCAAGNQPRMVATPSADGRTITFSFVDATNLPSPNAGHMDHLIITIADADHHTEDWTFVSEGKEQKEHFDLTRAKSAM